VVRVRALYTCGFFALLSPSLFLTGGDRDIDERGKIAHVGDRAI
jgi:hypothetical protein